MSQLILISDIPRDQGEPWIYHILENLNNFCYFKCDNRSFLPIQDVAQTLILEGYEHSSDPIGIAKQIKSKRSRIDIIVLVGTSIDPSVYPSVIGTPMAHYIFGKERTVPVGNANTFTIKDRQTAVDMMGEWSSSTKRQSGYSLPPKSITREDISA